MTAEKSDGSIPFFAIGNDELQAVEGQRLCKTSLLKCRDCGKLLSLEQKDILIVGHCENCNKGYLIAIEHISTILEKVISNGKKE